MAVDTSGRSSTTATATETTSSGWKDYGYVVRHSAFKGTQAGSLIAPPAYVAYAMYKGRPTLNGLLRATWLTTGTATFLGIAAAIARLHSATPESISDRRQRLEHNEGQMRVDEFAGLGSWVVAIATVALFRKQAPLSDLVLGGVGLGSASGVLTHLALKYREGESMKPEGMADIITGK